MDQNLKSKLDRLKQLHDQRDKIDREMERLQTELPTLVERAGLDRTKFDFGDKFLRYQRRKDYGAISQKLIKQVLTERYPQINQQQFIQPILERRTVKVKPVIEIIRKK